MANKKDIKNNDQKEEAHLTKKGPNSCLVLNFSFN